MKRSFVDAVLVDSNNFDALRGRTEDTTHDRQMADIDQLERRILGQHMNHLDSRMDQVYDQMTSISSALNILLTRK